MTDWFERQLYGEGWKVYGLLDLPNGWHGTECRPRGRRACE
jgi:hypothetical protein